MNATIDEVFLFTLVKGHTATTTSAHPAHTIPTFATFLTNIKSFHFTFACARLCFDPDHAIGFFVVNINLLFL